LGEGGKKRKFLYDPVIITPTPTLPHQGLWLRRASGSERGGNWADAKFFPSPRGRGWGRGIKKEIPIRSSYFKMFWTPAFAGETTQKTFYETIKFGSLEEPLKRIASQRYADASHKFFSSVYSCPRSSLYISGRKTVKRKHS